LLITRVDHAALFSPLSTFPGNAQQAPSTSIMNLWHGSTACPYPKFLIDSATSAAPHTSASGYIFFDVATTKKM
jgi:hypothetical protein